MTLVQVLTESLPISSSSHVRLCDDYLARCGIATVQFEQLWHHWYNLAHIPTLIASVLYLIVPLCQLLMCCITDHWYTAQLMTFFAVVTGITVLAFYGLQRLEQQDRFIAQRIPIAPMLAITAGALASTYWCCSAHGSYSWDIWYAVLLGLVQGIALLPGLSRMALTTAAGCWYGVPLQQAFEISLMANIILNAGGAVRAWLMMTDSERQQVRSMISVKSLVLYTIVGYVPLVAVGMLAAHNLLWLLCIYVSGLALAVNWFNLR